MPQRDRSRGEDGRADRGKPRAGALVLRPDTPLDQDVKDMIARQLDKAEDRFAAIAG